MPDTKAYRYRGWRQNTFEGVNYLLSPDRQRIAYEIKGKKMEFTWSRANGGFGPQLGEGMEDYVKRKFNGSGKKQDMKGLAKLLVSLAERHGRKGQAC